MSLPIDTVSGKLTYLGHDAFLVTMSILASAPIAQSRGCKNKRDKYTRVSMGENLVFK